MLWSTLCAKLFCDEEEEGAGELARSVEVKVCCTPVGSRVAVCVFAASLDGGVAAPSASGLAMFPMSWLSTAGVTVALTTVGLASARMISIAEEALCVLGVPDVFWLVVGEFAGAGAQLSPLQPYGH